jgi:hypothetical protein
MYLLVKSGCSTSASFSGSSDSSPNPKNLHPGVIPVFYGKIPVFSLFFSPHIKERPAQNARFMWVIMGPDFRFKLTSKDLSLNRKQVMRSSLGAPKLRGRSIKN